MSIIQTAQAIAAREFPNWQPFTDLADWLRQYCDVHRPVIVGTITSVAGYAAAGPSSVRVMTGAGEVTAWWTDAPQPPVVGERVQVQLMDSLPGAGWLGFPQQYIDPDGGGGTDSIVMGRYDGGFAIVDDQPLDGAVAVVYRNDCTFTATITLVSLDGTATDDYVVSGAPQIPPPPEVYDPLTHVSVNIFTSRGYAKCRGIAVSSMSGGDTLEVWWLSAW